jgi:phosphatidate cytidylyltransferase
VKRVLTAAILIPIVVLALFKAPLWLFSLLVLAVALLASREYLDIAEANGLSPFRAVSYTLVACVFVVAFMIAGMMTASYLMSTSIVVNAVGSAALLMLIASPFILLVAGLRRSPLSQSLPDAASSFLLLPYVAAALASMILVRSYSNGSLFLLFTLLLVWTGDVAAYYVGRALGKNKLAPRISPGKTWEGAIASTMGAVVVGVLLFHYLRPIYFTLKRIHMFPPTEARDSFAPPDISVPLLGIIAFAICVNVAAQLGDLVESMLKRGGGVKDSGTLLPGHGGVLDRIDALLFALPVGWFFYFAVLGEYFRGVPYLD